MTIFQDRFHGGLWWNTKSLQVSYVRPGDVHNLDEQRPRLDIKAIELRGVVPDQVDIRRTHLSSSDLKHGSFWGATADLWQETGSQSDNYEYVWLGRGRGALLEFQN